MAKNNTPAIVTPPSEYALAKIENVEAAFQALQINMGNTRITLNDLEQINVPSGSGSSWEIPSADGDGTESVKEFGAIMIDIMEGRRMWQAEFGSGAKSPPDCYSNDGINGYGNPGGSCALCPLSKFGSAAKGRAPKCSERRWIFALFPHSVLPFVVNVPGASLKACRKFMMRQGAYGKSFFTFVTHFALSKEQGSSAEYSEIVFRAGESVDPEMIPRIMQYRELIKNLVQMPTRDEQAVEHATMSDRPAADPLGDKPAAAGDPFATPEEPTA